MHGVNDLLGKISRFNLNNAGKSVSFQGVLEKEKTNIILNAKLSLERYREFAKSQLDVFGRVKLDV